MLRALAEAQVQGSVQTRAQALEFVRRWRTPSPVEAQDSLPADA
jgi:hypothetical protein